MEPKVVGALVLPHQTAQQQRLQHLAQIKSTVCYCSECGNQLKFRSFSVHPCFTRAVSQHGKYRARQLVKRLNQRPEAEQSRHVSHSVPSLAPPPVQHVHVTIELQISDASSPPPRLPPTFIPSTHDATKSKRRRSNSPSTSCNKARRDEEALTTSPASSISARQSKDIPASATAEEAAMFEELGDFGM